MQLAASAITDGAGLLGGMFVCCARLVLFEFGYVMIAVAGLSAFN